MTSNERNWNDDCQQINWNDRKILWPLYDMKLRQVNDWVHDLNLALLHLGRAGKEQRVAVQAGGACGIWPLELAEHFELVYTYEPDPLNYWCLAANCSHLPHKISHQQMALGEKPGRVRVKLPPSEKNNAGAGYTVLAKDNEVGTVPLVTLDDQPLFNVDLLCLDVEGREVEVLRGAYKVIEQWQPLVMLEEKALPQMGPGKDIPHHVGAATEWLQKMHGYQIVGKIHRDVILAPPVPTPPQAA